jgi:hypothetical protein
MVSESQEASTPKAMVWAGRVLSALIVLMLIFSGVMKLAAPAAVLEEFKRLGWPESVILGLGIAEITAAILYAIPQTAVLGAIVLTGYLGGAVATHVRLPESFIAPAIIGALAWLGLYLRDARIRRLIPLRW